MSGSRWQPEEIEYLRDLVGDYPFSVVISDFNAWAASRGRPVRSRAGIMRQLSENINASSVTTETAEWMTTGDLAKHLRRCQDLIGVWIRRGFFLVGQVRKDGYGWFVSRDGIRHLARTRPQLMRHLSREKLFDLLEDDELVQSVLASKGGGRPEKVPIVCVETGETYPSILAAARKLKTVPSNIAQAVRVGRPARGFHFRKAS